MFWGSHNGCYEDYTGLYPSRKYYETMLFKESLEQKWQRELFEYWLSKRCVTTVEVLKKDKSLKEILSMQQLQRSEYDISDGR